MPKHSSLAKKFLLLIQQIRQLIPYDPNVAKRKCSNLIADALATIPQFNRKGRASIQRQIILDALRDLRNDIDIAVAHAQPMASTGMASPTTIPAAPAAPYPPTPAPDPPVVVSIQQARRRRP